LCHSRSRLTFRHSSRNFWSARVIAAVSSLSMFCDAQLATNHEILDVLHFGPRSGWPAGARDCRVVRHRAQATCPLRSPTSCCNERLCVRSSGRLMCFVRRDPCRQAWQNSTRRSSKTCWRIRLVNFRMRSPHIQVWTCAARRALVQGHPARWRVSCSRVAMCVGGHRRECVRARAVEYWRFHLLICRVAGAADTGGSAVEAAAAAAMRKEASKEAVRAEVCGKFTGTPIF